MQLIALLFALLSLQTGHAMPTLEKTVYGYVEKVTLMDNDITLAAKLDTGAKSASLNATNITEITVNGKPYLSFVVPTKQGDSLFKCEYVGEVAIKMRPGELRKPHHTLTRKAVKRPVVLMWLKLGDQERLIHVNLANRKRFIYPLLLGRDAIKAFGGIIDPSEQFVHKTQKKSTT